MRSGRLDRTIAASEKTVDGERRHDKEPDMSTKRTERPDDSDWVRMEPDLRVAAAAAVMWEIRDTLDDIAKSLRVLSQRRGDEWLE